MKNMSESIANIVELVGSSDKGWHEAVEVALEEAMKTIRGITGLEVVSKTAVVDPNNGRITKYHATIKLAFGIER
jgi:flavin-binding protein dodecin